MSIPRKLIDTLELTNHLWNDLFIKRQRRTTQQGLFSVFVLQFFFLKTL